MTTGKNPDWLGMVRISIPSALKYFYQYVAVNCLLCLRPENVDLPSKYQEPVGLLSPSELEESPAQNQASCDFIGPFEGMI